MLTEMQLERIVHERNRRDIVARLRQGEMGVAWAAKVDEMLEGLLFKDVSLLVDLTDLTIDDDGVMSRIVLGTPKPDTWIDGETVAEQLGAAYYRELHDLSWPDAVRYSQFAARKAIVDTFIERVNVRGYEPESSWIEWRALPAAAEQMAMLPVLVGVEATSS